MTMTMTMKKRYRYIYKNKNKNKMRPASVGFIGSGNMATAIMRGMVESKRIKPSNIHATDINPRALSKLSKIGVNCTSDNLEVAKKSDMLVLAVKPPQMTKLLKELKPAVNGNLLVSIAAGISLDTLDDPLPDGTRVARVMPNVNCQVGKAASAFCLNEAATRDDAQAIEKVFSAVGEIEEIPETTMDAMTALTGSGPAIVCSFIEALADGGVRAGIPRAVANKMAAQTVLGTAESILEEGHHPGVLKDMICSPGGTSIAGLHGAEDSGIRGAAMAGIQAAFLRSRELKKEFKK
eukprot:gb/GECH01007945.1/.p1 GENE.gb/GECH01007945.1/~~gb/GECH01007945.1/.p1  ORF type:complete len:294 (+),score=50.89 gb/GECH01007945.1/:1-882(+)